MLTLFLINQKLHKSLILFAFHYLKGTMRS
jgi:hypothetical protein